MGRDHERSDDSVNMDQTPDSPEVDGHDFIEHDDGSTDDDEGS